MGKFNYARAYAIRAANKKRKEEGPKKKKKPTEPVYRGFNYGRVYHIDPMTKVETTFVSEMDMDNVLPKPKHYIQAVSQALVNEAMRHMSPNPVNLEVSIRGEVYQASFVESSSRVKFVVEIHHQKNNSKIGRRICYFYNIDDETSVERGEITDMFRRELEWVESGRYLDFLPWK